MEAFEISDHFAIFTEAKLYFTQNLCMVF